jgi:hypothetical protein
MIMVTLMVTLTWPTTKGWVDRKTSTSWCVADARNMNLESEARYLVYTGACTTSNTYSLIQAVHRSLQYKQYMGHVT